MTSAIITGTSTNGPITAVKASPEFIPNTSITTAIAVQNYYRRVQALLNTLKSEREMNQNIHILFD